MKILHWPLFRHASGGTNEGNAMVKKQISIKVDISDFEIPLRKLFLNIMVFILKSDEPNSIVFDNLYLLY